MKGSFYDLEYAAKPNVTRHDRPLGEIEAVSPWSVREAELEPRYPNKGKVRCRSPILLEQLLPMYIAQQCSSLS